MGLGSSIRQHLTGRGAMQCYESGAEMAKGAGVPMILFIVTRAVGNPAEGWGQNLAYMTFCEASQVKSAGTAAATGDFGFKVLNSSDPAETSARASTLFRTRRTCTSSSTPLRPTRHLPLCSHPGRPSGQTDERFGIAPIAPAVEEQLSRDVKQVSDVIGETVEAARAAPEPGTKFLLTNSRSYVEEVGKGTDAMSHTGKVDEGAVKDFRASLAKQADINCARLRLENIDEEDVKDKHILTRDTCLRDEDSDNHDTDLYAQDLQHKHLGTDKQQIDELMTTSASGQNIAFYLIALAFDCGDTGKGGRSGVAAPRSPPAGPARDVSYDIVERGRTTCFREVSQNQSAETPADFGFKVLTSMDPDCKLILSVDGTAIHPSLRSCLFPALCPLQVPGTHHPLLLAPVGRQGTDVMNRATSSLMSLTFRIIHLFQSRFGDADQCCIKPMPFLTNLWCISSLNLFWTHEDGTQPVGVSDICALDFQFFTNPLWSFLYTFSVRVFMYHPESNRPNSRFTGYGYFYVHLYWTGFCLPAHGVHFSVRAAPRLCGPEANVGHEAGSCGRSGHQRAGPGDLVRSHALDLRDHHNPLAPVPLRRHLLVWPGLCQAASLPHQLLGHFVPEPLTSGAHSATDNCKLPLARAVSCLGYVFAIFMAKVGASYPAFMSFSSLSAELCVPTCRSQKVD